MNYLGHAFLSMGDAELLTGNMIGDHVKGKLALEKYPPRVKQGIELHRKIDTFTDAHTALQRAKLLFKPNYGLYAGAIVDSLLDHFLANDPKYFASEKVLFDFAAETYDQLRSNQAQFPATFAGYFPYMEEYNWLYNYRTLKGIQRSLTGLARRAKYMPPVEPAYEIFVTHYYALNQCYYEFIDDVINFVKVELSR